MYTLYTGCNKVWHRRIGKGHWSQTRPLKPLKHSSPGSLELLKASPGAALGYIGVAPESIELNCIFMQKVEIILLLEYEIPTTTAAPTAV